MTQAEDLGYDDSYFPAAEDTERDPHISADDPAEYILSHSPPSPIAHMSMQEAEERVQALREEVEHMGRGEGEGGDGEGRGGRGTSPVSPSRTIRPGYAEGLEDSAHHEAGGPGGGVYDRDANSQEQRRQEDGNVQLGTHMSPTHPGYLEHIPAPALSPDDLADPVHQHGRVVEHHQQDPAVSPTRTTDSMPLHSHSADHDGRGIVTDRDIESALQLDLPSLHAPHARADNGSALGTSPTGPPTLARSVSHPEARDTQRSLPQYHHATPALEPDRPVQGHNAGRHVTIASSSPISVPHPQFSRSQTVPAREIPGRDRARRRKSHSTHNQVAEAVFFSYGVSVFFGFQPDEERMVMEDIDAAGCWVRGADEEDWEVEEFHYVVCPFERGFEGFRGCKGGSGEKAVKRGVIWAVGGQVDFRTSRHPVVRAGRDQVLDGMSTDVQYDGDAEYPRIYNDMFSESTFRSLTPTSCLYL